jgi:hypothetical protein
MPLSSVVGAQSIVKPGVCTSSTRPASPYVGQCIYETDTLLSKVWTGSAWADYPPGKANTASPTFTGAVTLPADTSIGTVSATEIGYVDGVTSAIQTQFNAIGAAATTYTPTVIAIVGTATTVSATGKFVRVNKLMFVNFKITCTTVGSATVGFYLGTPSGFSIANPAGTPVGGNRENAISGSIDWNLVASTSVLSVFCFPRSGGIYDGTAVFEVA